MHDWMEMCVRVRLWAQGLLQFVKVTSHVEGLQVLLVLAQAYLMLLY